MHEKKTPSYSIQVMHSMDIHIVPNLLMAVGLASVGINICAGKVCQDSLDPSRFPRWKTFLPPFFCFSVFITSLLLVAMILSFALQPSLEESLKIGLKNGIRFYKVGERKTKRIKWGLKVI